MAGGVYRIALCALLNEELPGDEQRSGENKREHRGRELTDIIHRTSFSVICSDGERGPTIDSS
jgi:hypothetical protein